jgi:hypothetical protein
MNVSLSPIHSSISFAGYFFLVSALLLWIGRLWSPPSQRMAVPSVQWRRVALASAVLVTLAIPINSLSAAAYLRGIMGDLSIISVLLLGAFVAGKLTGRDFVPQGARETLLNGIAIVAMIFYPLALGSTVFDPYQLGFRPVALLAVLVGVVLVLWRREPAAAVLVLLGLIAFNLRLLESTNLWDYLLDAWLVLFAWGWIAKRQFQRRSSPRPEKRSMSANSIVREPEPPPFQA